MEVETMDRLIRIQSSMGFAAAGLIIAAMLLLATAVGHGQQLPSPPSSPQAVPVSPPAPLPPPAGPAEQNPPATGQPLPGPIGVLRPEGTSGTVPLPAAGANRGLQDPGYLGVVTDDRQDNGSGVRVMDLETGGPADRAGLKQADLITSLNGRAVHTENDMMPVLQQLGPGSKVSFGINRNGQQTTVDVTLGTRPPAGQRRYEKFGRIAESLPEPNGGGLGAENAAPPSNGAPTALPSATVPPATVPPSASPQNTVPPGNGLPGNGLPGNAPPGNFYGGQPGPAPLPPALSTPEPTIQLRSPIFPSNVGSHRMLLGVRTQQVTEEIQQQLGLRSATGALVVSRTLGSPAAIAGIPINAVITAVDGKAVLSPFDLTALITEAGPGREVEISYLYKGAQQRAKVRLADAEPTQGGLPGNGSATASPIPAPPSPQRGSFPVADDKARIEALEQRVERLEHRVDDLERQLRKSQ
jgi:hypothetical protein